jgi:pimeloyl-ACP methyl ester carboxylesterase
VVLVHGWACDLEFWNQQVPDLAARARVVALDLPGHGLSDKPEREYSMAFFGRAVAAVLADAGVDEAALVGHSMGALVARQALESEPRRVRALVLADGSLRPYFKTAEEGRPFREPFQADYPAAMRGAIQFLSGGMRPDDREWVEAHMLATPRHVALSAMGHMHDPASYPTGRVGVPLGAVMARSEHWQGYQAFLRGLSPRVDYRELAGVSHFLMIDDPPGFNAALLGILEAQGFLRPAATPSRH